MKRLLWVGDAVCPSGFALATHKILDTLRHHYDVTVLGINYYGDPHDHPYPIYGAIMGGDAMGVGRIVWMCDLVQPDVIVIQQDGWQIQPYVQQLRRKKPNGEYWFPEHAAVPIVAALAVDGKNFRSRWLEGVDLAIFWTQFALAEAREGGYVGAAQVIPLGVDLETYYPVDRDGALDRLKIGQFRDKFIVGNVNRNQPRKRWDLTLKFFAEWVGTRKIDDALLFLHAAPTGDNGIDIEQMANYYGIAHLMIGRTPPAFCGATEDVMRDTYNVFSVQVTTTQGEGFGLTTFEGMACGVPQVVPDWAALGELCRGAASMVPCVATGINPVSPGLNVIGGVPDKRTFVDALDALYRVEGHRELVGRLGLERASEDRFRWANVGLAWVTALAEVFEPTD